MGVTKMSKRIEKLEEEKIMEEKDFNLKESSLGDFLNYIRILAKLEERKQAEKEFLDKLNELDDFIEKIKNDIISTEKPFGKIYGKEVIGAMTDGGLIMLSQVDDKLEELKQKITGEEK